MKKTILALLMLLPALAFSQARWFEVKEIKIGAELPDTNGAYIIVQDGKLYFMDWAGANYKRLRAGDMDFRIGFADSLVRSPYGQFGTAFGSPEYPLRVNGNSLFYDHVYMRDGYGVLSYNGNGARMVWDNAVGITGLNNKGTAFRIAQNAASGALLVDSSQITAVAPKFTLTNSATALQFLATSGSYGWIGTSTNDQLYIGTNNSGRLNISATGEATFTKTVTATQFRLSALNTAPANATDTGTLGEIRIVDGYIYVCTATNTWKRAAIATW